MANLHANIMWLEQVFLRTILVMNMALSFDENVTWYLREQLYTAMVSV